MTVAETINVSQVLLESPSFGATEIGQLEEAIAASQCGEVMQFQRELQLKVDQGSASERDLLAAGITAYLLANHADADRYLSKISGNGLADFYRAQSLLALGQHQAAADAYASAGTNGYDAVQCALCRAGAIRLSGDTDAADELLAASSREGATRAEYSYQKGCILADRGDAFGAIEYFERAVDMDPHHGGALFRLAGENNLLGNDADAITLYERSLSRPPLFKGALINLGLLYEDSESYSAAAFCFRRVLEVFPNDERAQLYLKDIEASSDMYYDEDADRARRELDQVLRIPITDFELSARSRNCLESAGIHTLGDLTNVSEQELLGGKNFGETSLTEIRESLEPRGLRIGQSVEEQRKPAPAYDLEELSPQERALLEKPVTELGLSVRARKCLSRLGIVLVGELVSRTADELTSVRNFGVTSLNEIRAKLTDFDLKLRND